MHKKAIVGLSIVLITLLFSSAVGSVAGQTSSLSNSTSSAKYPPYPVNLYEFYKTDCPHCQALAPTIDALAAQYPTLHVHKIEINNNTNYSIFADKFLPAYGLKIDGVPAVFIGTKAFQGDEFASQIQAEVARAVQSGATGAGDQIMGNVVPTPTPGNHTQTATTTDQSKVQGDLPSPSSSPPASSADSTPVSFPSSSSSWAPSPSPAPVPGPSPSGSPTLPRCSSSSSSQHSPSSNLSASLAPQIYNSPRPSLASFS